MSFIDTLQQYATRALGASADASPEATVPAGSNPESDFHQAAQQVPNSTFASGLASAMRAPQTPPFGQLASQLFQHSDPTQRASLLNQLIAAAGPAVLSRVAGGLFAGGGQAPAAGGLSPAQASQLSPDQVREIAQAAEQKDGSIVDRIGSLYAQHPQVVKALGAAFLAVALGHIAQQHNGKPS